MKFYEKITEILRKIGNKDFSIIESFKDDKVLLRHFLHNLDHPEWLDKTEPLMDIIFSDKENRNLQIELIGYFERIIETKTPEILQYLIKYLPECYPSVYRRVAFLIEKMNIKGWFDYLYDLSFVILESSDYITKEFAIRNSGDKLIWKYNTQKLMTLAKHIMHQALQTPEPNNTDEVPVVKGAGITFNFKVKDLYDASFREAVSFITKIAKTQEGSIVALEYLIEEYNKSLAIEVKEKRKQTGEIQYLSTWRLPKSFHKENYHKDNPTEKFALEIWSILTYRKKDKETFNELVKILLNTNYVVYFEILVRILDDESLKDLHNEIKERIILNTFLRESCEIGDARRYNLFQRYWTLFPEDVKEFSPIVKAYDKKESKDGKPYRRIGILAASIPDDKRDSAIREVINAWRKHLSDNWITEADPIPYEDDNIRELDRNIISNEELLSKSVEELIDILIDYSCTDRFEKSIWDLYEIYKNYFIQYPDRRKTFYELLPDPKDIKWLLHLDWYLYTIWCTTQWYIETINKADRTALLDRLVTLNRKLFTWDEWSRRNIISTLNSNEWLRDEEFTQIKESNKELYQEIVYLIASYASFKEDPKKIEKEDDTYALVTYAKNTVVGWAIELLVLMLYFDPKNDKAKDTIREIMTRNNVVQQAVVVRNLVYIIPDAKDYEFCKEIIAQVEEKQVPAMQYAMIEYMYKLGGDKLQTHFQLIDKILETSNKDIGTLLWDFLLQLLVNGISWIEPMWIDNILKKIISEPIKHIATLDRFTRSLSNNMPFVFRREQPIQEKVLTYYKKICEIPLPKEEEDRRAIHHVKLAASYFLDKRSVEQFNRIEDNNIFEILLETKVSDVYQNINEYLLKCIKANKEVSKCINILKKEINMFDGELGQFLTQYPYDKEISLIIDHVKKEEKKGEDRISKDDINTIDEIFDKGIYFWWKDFYDIFHKHYNGQ